jgi:hypothetical protein
LVKGAISVFYSVRHIEFEEGSPPAIQAFEGRLCAGMTVENLSCDEPLVLGFEVR